MQNHHTPETLIVPPTETPPINNEGPVENGHELNGEAQHQSFFPPPALGPRTVCESSRLHADPPPVSNAYRLGFDAGMSIDPEYRSDYVAGLLAGIEIRIKADLYFENFDGEPGL